MNDESTNFIHNIIDKELAAGKLSNGVVTRFPPEPNGFLHIGHAKAIWINFETAKKYGGVCHLRFDDTNPFKEEERYALAIAEDIRWLGYEWFGPIRHASDYFDQLYEYAITLIKLGKAYVCSLTADQIRDFRGTLTEPGKDSPYRDRTVEENLDLLTRMRAGEFQEGEHVLRAKIDMQSGNINMRDPAIYRIRKVAHQRTGDAWCLYPLYDFTHGLSDALEGITHSLCSLEFQDHRPLYDWFLEALSFPHRPQQIEFSRLNVSHVLTSKRKLKQLIDEGVVDDWDDPRMPTLSGLRKRGYPARALLRFCELSGVSKSNSVMPLSLLEECVRDELNVTAPRALCVQDPIKVVIENYPAEQTETVTVANHPQDTSFGERTLTFSRELYIERDDFNEEPPKKYKRLSPGGEVRLRHAYVIKCEEVIKDAQGRISELRCSYDPDTLGKAPADRKIKGVIHWVDAKTAVKGEIREYQPLFTAEDPGAAEDILACVNRDSRRCMSGCLFEASLAQAPTGQAYQFERLGYYTAAEGQAGELLFHQVVALRAGG